MAEDEEEVASGLLTFTVDGAPRTVPELRWRANRAWQARMQETFVSLAGIAADTPEGFAAMSDAERALVLAYDVTGALGDLEDATEREISAIYNRLVDVSYPLAESRATILLAIVRAAVASAQESSGNSPSPSGSSAPTPLKRRSPSARSRSSTPRRRSA